MIVGRRGKHRLDVQALRGVAVSLVVLDHFDLGPFHQGFLGVDIFFVLSGFLITGIIARDAPTLTDFYIRRARRILPAAFVVIALTLMLSPWFVNSIEMESLGWQAIGALTFTTNFVLWQQAGYFDIQSMYKPLLHMWSLAMEEQFYVFFPVLLMTLPKRFWVHGIALLVTCSFVACLIVASTSPEAAFYLLPTRAWELGIGALGALIVANGVTVRWATSLTIPALVLLGGVSIFSTGLPHPGVDALLVCLATLLLLLADAPLLNRGIVPQKLARVGDISYSLYLVHWPLASFLASAFMGDIPLEWRIAGLALSMVLAVGLHALVENPFRYAHGRKLITAVVGSLLVSATAAAVPLNDQSAERFAEMRRPNRGISDACARVDWERLPECQTTAEPKIAVWGDSFAMHLMEGLAKQIGQHGLIQITISSCTPLPSYERPDDEFGAICDDFNGRAFEYLTAQEEIETVILAGAFDVPARSNKEEFQYALLDVVQGLQDAGKRVVVFAPPPSDGQDPSACIERKLLGKVMPSGDCSIDAGKARVQGAYSRAVLSEVEDRIGARVIDYFDQLCGEATCNTILDGVPLYRDERHLSFVGSVKLLEVLEQPVRDVAAPLRTVAK